MRSIISRTVLTRKSTAEEQKKFDESLKSPEAVKPPTDASKEPKSELALRHDEELFCHVFWTQPETDGVLCVRPTSESLAVAVSVEWVLPDSVGASCSQSDREAWAPARHTTGRISIVISTALPIFVIKRAV